MRPAAAKLRSWREPNGILRFVQSEFGVTPDKWQEQALLAIEDPRDEYQRVSLQACAGPGKTAVQAWGGWWFLGCQGDVHEHPKGAATAITSINLRDNLWAEYSKWQGHSDYLKNTFTWTSERIFANDHPETWFMSARTWPRTATPDQQGATLSGLHSPYVMAQVDESGGVPTTVLRAAEQALTTAKFGKIVQSGNPISLEGMLYAAFVTLRHMWHVVIITGDPEDPNAWIYSPRVGDKPKKLAEQNIATYGRDNPWVQAYILGKFPPGSINALLNAEEVEEAMKRVIRPEAYEWNAKRLGVDVARFGDDKTVIGPRQGLFARKPIQMRKQNTADIATRVAQARMTWSSMPGGDALIIIDDTGHWAHGTLDQLVISGHAVHPVVFNAPAISTRYKNRRTEMYIEFAKWVRRGGRLPYVPELIPELTATTYTFSNGVFVLEDKDLVKEKIGRSPDIADAYALTFAVPDMPHEEAAKRFAMHAGKAMTMDRQLAEQEQRISEQHLIEVGRARRMDDGGEL